MRFAETNINPSFTYERFGSGNNVMITFHGFGQSPFAFTTLAQKKNITVFSFALPTLNSLHPSASLQESFMVYFQQFLQEHRINSFSLVGFSIGARLVFLLLRQFSSKVNTAYVLAPDGVSEHWVFRLATRTTLGRRLFFSITHQWHHEVLTIARLFNKLGVMSAFQHRLIKRQLSNSVQRELLFTTWISSSAFKYQFDALGQHAGHTKMKVILAKSDWLIGAKHVQKLSRYFKHIEFTTLEATHENLISKWVISLPYNFVENDSK